MGNSGFLLYKEFDDKIKFSETLNENLNLEDGIKHRKHTNEDVILQKIYQSIAGYHIDDNADELRVDPSLTIFLGKKELASQHTISRVNNALTKNSLKQFEKINEILQDRMSLLKIFYLI